MTKFHEITTGHRAAESVSHLLRGRWLCSGELGVSYLDWVTGGEEWSEDVSGASKVAMCGSLEVGEKP